jgi:hypothetical protein
MGDFKRVQIIQHNASGLARDRVVNTIHFRESGVGLGAQSDQTMANDVWAKFALKEMFIRGCSKLETRVYDMEDAPGPPTATKLAAVNLAPPQGPREVALCLSFRGADNNKRSRGRIYLGPLNCGTERPNDGLLANALQLAQDMANIGGADIDWCVFSPTTRGPLPELGPSFKPIKLAWCDDEWDTMRSRGYRATKRSELVLNE